MIRSIGDLRDERQWGHLACRISRRSKDLDDTVYGAALSVDHLASWIHSESFRDSLEDIYGDLEGGGVGPWGRLDRRLELQLRMLREQMPDGLSEAILNAADQAGPGPWVVVSSPPAEEVLPTAWRAGIAGTLLEASILSWSEMLSDLREKSRNPEGLAGGLVIIQDSAGTKPTIGPDSWDSIGTELPSLMKIDDIRSGGPRNRIETAYGFGMLYNRLVRPQDPFSYMDAMVRHGPEDADDPWILAFTAAGMDPDLRRRAVAGMEGVISELPSAETPASVAPSGRKVRQVSGTPAAPGRRTGRIRRDGSQSRREENFVIVANGELDADQAARLPDSAGLIEAHGGRGGPGAWLCRRYGIPGVCEVENADWLPDSGQVIVDGDNGIITLLDSSG